MALALGQLSIKASLVNGNLTDTLLSRLMRRAQWDFRTYKTQLTDLHSDFSPKYIVL